MATNVRVSKGDMFKTKNGVLINTVSRVNPRAWTRLPDVFNKRFGVGKFIEENGRKDKDIYYQKGVTDRETGMKRDVITMIVKETEWDSVEESHLTQLLFELKEFCEKHRIYHVVMPKICCGVHGCRWANVNKLLRGVFDGSNVQITVKYREGDKTN